jgi:hypothetical protein
MIYKKYFDISLLACISFLLFFFKWAYSLFFFTNEDFFLKILSNGVSDGYFYYPFIKLLANVDFTNNFDGSYNENYFLPIPYGSIIYHAFFYKIFGSFSFILLEFISILFFLLIFYYIFIFLKINKQISIFLSTFLFCLPSFISFMNLSNYPEINTFVYNFYNLRFPRPLIVNLYFFSFILLLIYSFKCSFFKKKNIFLFSLLLGLSFSSAFYVFLFQVFSLIIVLIYKYKKKIFYLIIINYKKLVLAFLFFFILIFPFLFLLNFSSQDYLNKMGLIFIDNNMKIYLFKYYLSKLFRFKLVLLYVLVFLFIYFFNYKQKKINSFILNIFFINFFSSIFSVLFFIFFSSKIALLYHFNNLVVINFVLLLFIIFLYFVIFICRNKYRSSKNFNYFLFILLIPVIFFYNYSIYKDQKLLDANYRISQNQVISKIKDTGVDLNKTSLLTFDYPIITWAIFNNITQLPILGGTYSLKNDIKIEKDLILSFKILNLSKVDFIDFFENKRKGYRYINSDIQSIFFTKYQANSLTTFNSSKNFSEEIMKFIDGSSPLYTHQIIIPNEEIFRLQDLFDKVNYNLSDISQFIVISKKHPIIGKSRVSNLLYNKILDNEYFLLYEKKRTN